MTIDAGRVLSGRYRLIRPVGQGSQASVWVADHLALNTQVAVKLIDPDLAKKDDARERFRREATAAAQLRSAHVVQILDHGIDEGQPFIAMELLDGEDLFERLNKRVRLTLQETSKIVTQVARALTRAHAAGIVHRDLKPENVFLVPNDDEEIVKVLDFGVAKVSDPAKRTMQRTGIGTLIGTPHYMSPEQVKGIAEVDYRTDIWALGVIGYQCVTGKMPFDSEGVGDLLIKITIGEVPVPSAACSDLPRVFDTWFAKACERDPDKRFESARDLAEALARAAGLGVISEDTGRNRFGPLSGMLAAAARVARSPSSSRLAAAPSRSAPASSPRRAITEPLPLTIKRGETSKSEDPVEKRDLEPKATQKQVAGRKDSGKKESETKEAAAAPRPRSDPPRPRTGTPPLATKSESPAAQGAGDEIPPTKRVATMPPPLDGDSARQASSLAEGVRIDSQVRVEKRDTFDASEIVVDHDMEAARATATPLLAPPSRVDAASSAERSSLRKSTPAPPATNEIDPSLARTLASASGVPSSARSVPRSTVSGLASSGESTMPPPGLDGSRRRRIVSFAALLLLGVAGAVTWTVVRSRWTGAAPSDVSLGEPAPTAPAAMPAEPTPDATNAVSPGKPMAPGKPAPAPPTSSSAKPATSAKAKPGAPTSGPRVKRPRAPGEPMIEIPEPDEAPQ
jgi:serine/threonine-protein kinase